MKFPKGKIVWISTFWVVLQVSMAQAQVVGIHANLNDFLSGFGYFMTSSCDPDANDISVQENWIRIKDKFYGSTTLFNECTGVDEPIAEYIKNYAARIKRVRAKTNFEFSIKGEISVKKGDDYFAIINRETYYEGKITSELTYKINFTYLKDQDPEVLRVIGFERYDVGNENKKYLNTLCSPPLPKIRLTLPLIFIGTGGASFGLGLYFKDQSNQQYLKYVSTFPSPDSDNLYNRANQLRHTGLILGYISPIIVGVGDSVLFKKLLNRRKFKQRR
jgi:hypothetical protein